MSTRPTTTNRMTDLLSSTESVAITLRYGDVTVDVTGDSVIFRDPTKTDEQENMLTSFSHDNFDDIVTAFILMREAAP